MAFLVIQVEMDGRTLGDTNTILLNGDSTKQDEILNKLVDLFAGISSTNPAALVTCVTSPNTQTITAGAGGVTVTLNKQ